MALLGLPDFQQPIRTEGTLLYAPYRGTGAYTLVPDRLEVARDARGRADFHLSFVRGESPQQPPEPYGVLSFRLRPRYEMETALEAVRTVAPQGMVQEAAFGAGFLRMQPSRDADGNGGDETVALPDEVREPVSLTWNNQPMPRYVIHVSQEAVSLLEKALQSEMLPVEAVAELEIEGVSPRLSVSVQFDPAALLDACRALGRDGIVAWDELVSFFHAGIAVDAQDLPLQVNGDVEEAQHRLFAETMADRLRQRFGAFVPAPDVADGGHLALPKSDDAGSGAFRWDLSEALRVPRPLLLHLHPLEAARELVRSEGLDAVVSRTVVPPISTGVLPLSIVANLPPQREGVLALGVTVEAPPNPPHRPQAIVETVELDSPDDAAELYLRFSPAEDPAYTYRTFAVVRDATGIERLEGEETSHAGKRLRLTVDDFPLRFVPVEASDHLLDLSEVEGICRWQHEDENVEMHFTLEPDRPLTTLVLAEMAQEPTLRIEATEREGDRSLILNSLPAAAQRIDLYSFVEYGPHEITVTCVFDDETASFAVDLLPEDEPDTQDDITVLAFEPQRSSRTWRWFAANPFRAGYRYRPHDRGDGTPGAWSDVCSPFASLTISVAEQAAIEEEGEC